jgi:hypothetical protein
MAHREGWRAGRGGRIDGGVGGKKKKAAGHAFCFFASDAAIKGQRISIPHKHVSPTTTLTACRWLT